MWRAGGWRRGAVLGFLFVVLVAGTVGLQLWSSSVEVRGGRMDDIAAHSSTPVYFAGRSYQGHDLTGATIFSHDDEVASETDRTFDRGDRLDVGYGSTCPFFNGDASCGDWLDIEMERGFLPFHDLCVGYSAGPRGTVLVEERWGAWDVLTGDLVLRIEEFDRPRTVQLVTALRPVDPGDAGGSTTTAALPPPTAHMMRRLRNACP